MILGRRHGRGNPAQHQYPDAGDPHLLHRHGHADDGGDQCPAQGERPRASQNTSLGRFHLTGIPPAPRGVPQIEVSFDIDANGILHVSAKDKATGKQQDITITGSGQLSEEEVQRMIKEAEAHAEEDRKFRELAEARNQGDALAYQLEKTLKDLGDKVPEADRKNIEAKIEALRQATKGDDAAAIRARMDEVQQAFSSISQQMYEQAARETQQQQQAEGTTGQSVGGTGGGGGGDDVIDAEFEASDDN